MANKKQSATTDEEIIAALIASSSITEAAARLNISARTIYDRMATRDFKAAYTAAKSDIIRGAVFNINNKLTEAIETVSELMTDKEVSPAIRLQAAQTILNNAQKFSERLSVEEYNVGEYTKSMFDIDF